MGILKNLSEQNIFWCGTYCSDRTFWDIMGDNDEINSNLDFFFREMIDVNKNLVHKSKFLQKAMTLMF